MDSADPAAVRLELLKSHLERSDVSIRAFDDHLYKIKGFAVTTCSAATLFAIQQDRTVMFLIAGLAAAGFWVLDASTRRVQRIFINRSSELEKFFREMDYTQVDKETAEQLHRLRTIPETFLATRRRNGLVVLKEMVRPGAAYLYVATLVLVTLIAILI